MKRRHGRTGYPTLYHDRFCRNKDKKEEEARDEAVAKQVRDDADRGGYAPPRHRRLPDGPPRERQHFRKTLPPHLHPARSIQTELSLPLDVQAERHYPPFALGNERSQHE